MVSGKAEPCSKSWKRGGFTLVVLLICITSTCVGFFIHQNIPTAEPTLRFVSIIYRHGDTAPQESYPLDPYKGESFWPEGLGVLLKKGKVGMYKLGGFLRRRYDGFLSAKYSPTETYALSSDFDRCLMSASLVLAGLYPPVGVQLWNTALKWQPIPVHTAPLSCDDILAVRKPCPLLSKVETEWKAIAKQKLDENHEFVSNISKNTGQEIESIYDIYHIYDNLLVAQEQGLSLPKWAQGDSWDKLQSLAKIDNLRLFAPPEMIKLKSGVLINEILSNMLRKADKQRNSQSRLSLYSARDLALVYLWRGLKIKPEITERPSYGAALIIELHEISDKYRVKIMYKNSYSDENLTVLKIEGCGDGQNGENDEMCDITTFTSASIGAVIEDFDKSCEIV
ncbi:unnamed protein product [Bemisia tabaci]|uniref:acid phosphatase n=1 Tax=Bemisia tabaci TaxID=7038 RepID=A0A9P0AMK7_BEMTA|nr:unnamed protein product [Bemisia tabaci]